MSSGVARWKVLVADDASAVARRVSSDLESAGLHVVGVAPDGITALELLAETSADALVLDIHMPRLGGLDVLSTLRREGRDCVVVVLTADDEPEIQRAASAAGADCVLRKATDAGRIAEVVVEALERRTSSSPVRESAARDDAPRAALGEAEPPRTHSEVRSVFFLSDDPPLGRRVEDALSELSALTVSTFTVEPLAEAFRHYADQRPDCVVIDMTEESAERLELLATLRVANATCLIVALVSPGAERGARRALAAGAHHVIFVSEGLGRLGEILRANESER